MDATAAPQGRIDVISDAICPWCWIGKRQLDGVFAVTTAAFKANAGQSFRKVEEFDHVMVMPWLYLLGRIGFHPTVTVMQ